MATKHKTKRGKSGKVKRGKVRPKRDGRSAIEARRRRTVKPAKLDERDPASDAAKLRATDPARLSNLMLSGRCTVDSEPGEVFSVDKVEASGWVTYSALDAAGKPVGPRHTITADRAEPVVPSPLPGPATAPGPAAATGTPSAPTGGPPVTTERVAVVGRRKGREWRGSMEPDGRMVVGRDAFPSPSAAASKLTGVAVNGWNFWRFVDAAGKEARIAALRSAPGRKRPAPVNVEQLKALRAKLMNRMAKLGGRVAAIDTRLKSAGIS